MWYNFSMSYSTSTRQASLFPINPSLLDDAYADSRAALAAGEATGKSGEELVEEIFSAAGAQYLTDIPSRTVESSKAFTEIGFTKKISDGFVPQYRLHVEVKSGKGMATDSIDGKFSSEIYNYILHGVGDEPRPYNLLAPWTPIHRLMVFVGTKQYSAHSRVVREFVRTVQSGEQPSTPAQQERSNRCHFANVLEITPRWVDALFVNIKRYNAEIA
jgi:hypothetical protein